MTRQKEKIDEGRQRVALLTYKLWTYGYHARSTYGLGLPFDCFVNDRFRVKVGNTMIKEMPRGVDFFALVKEGGEITFYKKFNPDHLIGDKSPLRIIPK